VAARIAGFHTLTKDKISNHFQIFFWIIILLSLFITALWPEAGPHLSFILQSCQGVERKHIIGKAVHGQENISHYSICCSVALIISTIIIYQQ